MNNGGDVLARGGRSATFPASGKNMTQREWDKLWEPELDENEETKEDAQKSQEYEE